MNRYFCYIKSHWDIPDWDEQVYAKNRKEAITLFAKKAGWSEVDIEPYVSGEE